MFSTKSTKKALFSSVLALVLCFTMLLGSTFAWFTDSAVSANNKIVAGTLDVELWQHTETEDINITSSTAPIFSGDILWEPNKTEVVYLSIKNNGSLALKYKVAIEVTEISDHDLTEVMYYAITPDAKIDGTQVTEWVGDESDAAKKLNAGVGITETDAVDVELAPGAEHFFALSVHMDDEATNKYQGDSITFDIKVLAGQATVEEDSFGDTYDENATYPTVVVTTVTDNAVTNEMDTKDGVALTLPVGAPLGDYTFEMSNKKVVTNAANETTVSMDLELLKDGVKVTDDGVTLYTVAIEVGEGKRVLGVTHNGAAVSGYTYANGVVTFETASFSPFTVTFDTIREVTGLSGAGTEADPYLINDYYDLCWFRDHVNTCAQDGSSQYSGKFIKLTADIDLGGTPWTPIGSVTKDHGSFYGCFDGDGHTISNLYVSLASGDGAGFFAKVSGGGDGPRAVVKNLVFENVDVSTPGSYVGGVIANAGGNAEIRNVTVKGDIYVSGYGYVGAIVGHGYPDMYDCHVEANDGSYVLCNYWCGGGLIGYAGEGGTIIDGCSVEGLYIWSAYGGAGALAGLLQYGNSVKDSYAENVTIELNSTYACGYACGNGEESTYENVSVKNVSVTCGGVELGDDSCDNDALIFAD